MKTKGNKTSKGITGPNPGDPVLRMPQIQRRYAIHSDGDHKYFVEVGMEGEFEQWIETWESKEAAQKYKGHDYEKNRIDGHFSFTDPRCE